VGLKLDVLSGLKWTAGAKFFTQLINWAFTIFVMRLLQPDDYGLLAMAAVFTSLCLLLNEMGLGTAIIQAKRITDDLLRQVFGMILLINILFLIAFLAFAPLISRIFDEPRLINIVRVFAFQFPIMAFFVIPNSWLTRDMKFRSISVVALIAELSNGVCTFILAWRGYGVWSLVIGSLVRVLVQCIGINMARPFLKLPSFKFKGFADTAKFGGLISLQRILWYFYSQADVFIIGRILGSTILGYYSVAMHIASLPIQKVSSILNQVGLPAYSKIQDDKDALSYYTLKATRVIGIVSIPIFFGISSIAAILIPAILGEKWIISIVPLQLLSLVMPLRILSNSLSPAVNGIGRPDINVKTLIVACIIMPISFLIGCQWGLLGVCWAWIISYSLWFIYMLSKVLPIIGLTMKQFFRVLIYPAILSTFMYIIVYLIRLILAHNQINPIISLLILTLAGGIVYLGGMFLFCKQVFFEALNILRKDR